MMADLPKPTRHRLTALAVMLLEEAAGEARISPIRRTLSHRLALAWLGYAGVAEPWQIVEFWSALAKVDMPDSPARQYCRDGRFDTLFLRWRANAGLPSDNYRWRAALTPGDTPISLK